MTREELGRTVNALEANHDDIRYAYRLLLGREPDDSGLAHFSRIIAKSRHGTLDVARYFLASPEFSSVHVRGDAPVEVLLDGYSVYVNPDDRDIGASVACGNYEPHVAAVVRKILRKSDVFVDVGANIGYFVALAASIVGPSGRVIAIEPMDKNVQLISAAIWRNRHAHVEVLPFAAGARAQLVPMMTSPGTSNGEVVGTTSVESFPSLFAQARTLDELLAPVERIDVIKFDIEGHELPAWEGFAQGMLKHRPLVLTEFHPRCMLENAGVEPADYLRCLFDYAEVVDVLLGTDHRVTCTSPEQVMAQWENADRKHGSTGSTHLDLFAVPRSSKRNLAW